MWLPLLAFSQKAYDAVDYLGKTADLTIRFTLGDGYIAACEIKTTDNNTKKTSRFLPEKGYPEEDKTMKFYHVSVTDRTFTDYFILKGIKEYYEQVPATISGVYYFAGREYPFVLKRYRHNR